MLGMLGKFHSNKSFPKSNGRLVPGNGLRVALGTRQHGMFLKEGNGFALQIQKSLTGKILKTVGIQFNAQVRASH